MRAKTRFVFTLLQLVLTIQLKKCENEMRLVLKI